MIALYAKLAGKAGLNYGTETRNRAECPDCGGPMFRKSARCFKCRARARSADPQTYILDRVTKETRGYADECWTWRGPLNHAGYGFGVNLALGGRFRVHRASYELFVGQIPAGLEIDHLCSNRSCCNPSHLEAVTPDENKRRAISRRGLSMKPAAVYARELRARKRKTEGVQ